MPNKKQVAPDKMFKLSNDLLDLQGGIIRSISICNTVTRGQMALILHRWNDNCPSL